LRQHTFALLWTHRFIGAILPLMMLDSGVR
jgi:hypothetical protein